MQTRTGQSEDGTVPEMVGDAVVVFGASSATGRLVVKGLLDRGHQVTAFVRNPDTFPIDDVRVRVHVGDALDDKAVDLAVSGAEAVVSLLGAPLGQPVGEVRSKGTANVMSAMSRHGARRLVAVSAVGGRRSADQLGAVTRRVYRRTIGPDRLAEVDRLEDLVVGSDLDWTLVRAPRLVDKQTKGRPRATDAARVGMSSTLSRADLAAVLVDQVSDAGEHRAPITVLSTGR